MENQDTKSDTPVFGLRPDEKPDKEMVRRVRDFDWAATALGKVSAWPQSLRTVVQVVLDAPFPNIVLWGPELIQIYNDGYRDLMGVKHPIGLGQSTRDCWPEVWHINAPIYQRVFAGESVSFEDALYPITRSGVLEDTWFTLSYSPVCDEAGKVSGVLVSVFETTERKKAEEAVRERTQELAQMGRMRQELLRQLVTAQEQERARIARDLHDDTGQQVTGLLLGLSALKATPSIQGDMNALSSVYALQELATDVAQKSHRIALNLRPTALDDIGLMQALRNYAEQWNQWSGLPLDLNAVGMQTEDGKDGQYRRLPEEIETTIYRIVQEALTNVLRHAIGPQIAAARHVGVLVRRSEHDVLTIIEDDGPGFDVEATVKAASDISVNKRRLGTFGMQERARLAGGTLEIESSPGAGTTLYLRLPLLQVAPTWP